MKQLVCDRCNQVIKDENYIRVKNSMHNTKTDEYYISCLCYGEKYNSEKHYCISCFDKIFELSQKAL